MKSGNLWDIFCRVIDNFGDIGVCWRLSADLAARGERVRLWVDDASALQWLAPKGAQGVEVHAWTQHISIKNLTPGDRLVEAFGCDVAPEFIAASIDYKRAKGQNVSWINLEHLTAQGFAERSHGLPSPVMTGATAGLVKHFYFPGFTAATGGLIREPDLIARQAGFDRKSWLQKVGIDYQGERLLSLFCYEPLALGPLLDRLAVDPKPTRLLITPGRAAAAVRACIAGKNSGQAPWPRHQALSFFFLPALSQWDFDHLLWACDLNFVRGEDSLVRAVWANKPFIWQLYPQHDDAHHSKLDAFLDRLKAPPSLRTFHQVWNGMSQSDLPEFALPDWQQTVTSARSLQMAQADLVTQLMGFGSKNH